MKRIFLLALSLALTSGSRAAGVPSETELKKLTDKSLLSFNSAVQKQDFADFYKASVKLWQEQTTPDKMKAAFKTFIDQKFDVASIVRDMKPRFDPPAAIDSDGVLVVRCSYPVEPAELSFDLKFYKEPGEVAWKLAGFHVVALPAKPEKVPSEAELKKLTDQSLLDFNSAVQKRDFADLYKSAATPWQEQTTPDKMKAAFQTFIDQKFDMASVVKNVKPAFEPPAAIDSNGALIVQGSYPIEPDKLTFKLTYLTEKSAWKLGRIDVHSYKTPKEGDDGKKSSSEDERSLSLTGKWVGYYEDGSKSEYVWAIRQTGSTLSIENVGGDTARSRGRVEGNKVFAEDFATQNGKLSADGRKITWTDGVVWKKQ